jgi:hypothetical protein
MRRALLFALLACSNAVVPSEAGIDGSADADPDAPSLTRTLVLRKLFAGDTDRAFKQSMTAWRTYGEDIDGLMTTPTSTDVCRLAQGAPASVHADGDGGIDNSFGATVLPLLMMNGLAIPSLQWSQSTQQGATRPILVRAAEASALFQLGSLLPSPPDFSGAGTWTVSSLMQPQLADVTTQGVRARVPSGALVLFVPFSKGALELRVHDFRLRTTPSFDAGSIAGVLDTNELIEAVRQAMGATQPAICNGFDATAAAIRQAQDIMLAGPQNPAADCNAISIGVGFESAAMGFGAMVNDPGPPKGCP